MSTGDIQKPIVRRIRHPKPNRQVEGSFNLSVFVGVSIQLAPKEYGGTLFMVFIRFWELAIGMGSKNS